MLTGMNSLRRILAEVKGVISMKAHAARIAVPLSGLLVLAVVACQSSETIAPDGSSISLAATPAVIVTSGGVQANDVSILATVRNTIGVALPGQDVRFTTTSGVLTPQAGLPVTTDKFGNATTILTVATSTATIAATSGKATASITLQTTTCNISTVTLDGSPNFTSCTPTEEAGGAFTMTVTVTDTSQNPCVGIAVAFKSSIASRPATDIALVFSPSQGNTDSTGTLKTTLTLDQQKCSDLCTGKNCNTSLQGAEAVAGSITSTPVPVNIQIQ
jgi:hypothetical protein